MTNSNDSKINQLFNNVQNLQKDMAQFGSLVERLDITIEKLTEVSTTVSQLLAVQGNRLEFQEKVASKLEELVEKRRQETAIEIKDVYIRIEKVEKDLQEDMDSNHEKIIEELRNLRDEGNEQHKSMENRISRFEKWMYMVLGGLVIVSVFFDKINLGAIFN